MILAHEFVDMPGHATDSVSPNDTIMLMRCKWCMKTPTKAREDGCPTRELAEVGCIRLSQWNPAGVDYFKGRTCVTCHDPIMEHWLRIASEEYWCYFNEMQKSEGINDCVFEVEGVAVPEEPRQRLQ